MSQIVPTILTNDKNAFNQTAASYATFAKRIQIDICDGIFTESKTVSENDIVLINQDRIIYDLHMMVKNPSEHILKICELRPQLCIFHAECNENLLPIFEKLKSAGIRTGVAILKTTFPGKIKPYIENADHALIFAGQLGKQGGDIDMIQIEKIPLIREIKPTIEIGWDGGVNMENIRALAHSDIDVINVGSALSRSNNPQSTFNELDLEAGKNGVVI